MTLGLAMTSLDTKFLLPLERATSSLEEKLDGFWVGVWPGKPVGKVTRDYWETEFPRWASGMVGMWTRNHIQWKNKRVSS